jgi:predicted metal-dependent phosphoesterase TrpH
MAGDLHVHSEASFDSDTSLEDRINDCRRRDIDTIALTDHNDVNRQIELSEEEFNGITVIAGIELFTDGPVGRADILGYFIEPGKMREQVSHLESGYSLDLDYREAIDMIHDAGGVAVLAHPGRYQGDLDMMVEHLTGEGLDGIEIEYTYDTLGSQLPHTDLDEIHDIAEQYDLVKTGGSDCHGPGKRYNLGEVTLSDERIEALREQ